ncbi:MAG: pollen Ole e 1 allergen/extensin family protein, partial [Deltaproteobacteria bacterium]|nr:pollen Ole e 1 allergen/extensin family protein [Deltaproteobacteria bacterium]
PPVYPPTKAPVKPPTKPPVKPPVYPPAKPPVMPPVYPPKFNRSLVAVRGTVYCKSCKYASFDTLIDAKPIEGAVVRLSCKSKKAIVAETTTDKNGYFLLLAPKTVTNFGFRGCRVYLVKSKDYKCSKVSKLFGGDIGAVLKPEKRPGKSIVIVNNLTYGLFNVGPFAFNPTCHK